MNETKIETENPDGIQKQLENIASDPGFNDQPETPKELGFQPTPDNPFGMVATEMAMNLLNGIYNAIGSEAKTRLLHVSRDVRTQKMYDQMLVAMLEKMTGYDGNGHEIAAEYKAACHHLVQQFQRHGDPSFRGGAQRGAAGGHEGFPGA